VITLLEKSIYLYLAGPPNDLYDLSDALKIQHPQRDKIDLYHLWKRTKGEKGWDGTVKPLKVDRSGHEASILRGHKSRVLTTMGKLGIEVSPNSKLITSPFAELTSNDINPDCIAGDFPLDHNQIHCILKWLQNGMGIGKIAVNGGKTATFAGFAATLKSYMEDARFVYITDRERLQSQVGDEMPKFLPGWGISIFGGGGQDYEGKDMVICTLAMLRTHKNDLEALGWFNTFNAVLFDECHHANADSAEELMLRFGGAFFRIGASDTAREKDILAQNRITGLLGPVLMQVDQVELIGLGRSAQPHIYVIDDKSWTGRYDLVPYTPQVGTTAWALLDGQTEMTQGIYKGPVIELDDQGNQVVVDKRILEGVKFVKVTEPKTVPGLHLIEVNGVDYEINSSYCLLERSVDRCIVRFKERNDLITEWSTFFAKQGKRTLVVATRLMHILILESLICNAYDPDLVRTLTGEDSVGTKNKTFEWFKKTKGAILITSLVKEGVSINEIEAGVVADYIGDAEFANQIVGRFLRRKKEGENVTEIAWFLDRQQRRFERGCKSVIQRLSEAEKGFIFYHPLVHPSDLSSEPRGYQVWDSQHEGEWRKDEGELPAHISL